MRLQGFPGKALVAQGVIDELQRRADARRVLNGEVSRIINIVDRYAGGTARSTAVATDRTDDVATA